MAPWCRNMWQLLCAMECWRVYVSCKDSLRMAPWCRHMWQLLCTMECWRVYVCCKDSLRMAPWCRNMWQLLCAMKCWRVYVCCKDSLRMAPWCRNMWQLLYAMECWHVYVCCKDSLRMAPWYRNMWQLLHIINSVSQGAYVGWYIERNRVLAHGNSERFVFPLQLPDHLWAPPSLLYRGYRGTSSGARSGVQNTWSHICIPPRVSTAWCFIPRGCKFSFTLVASKKL